MSAPTIAPQALARARRLLVQGGRRLLGIAGLPGAGKSTAAQALAEALGEAAMVVPMDGFHLANAELARLGRAARKGAPDTFDAAGYAALLERLRRPRAGETVYAPAFHREIEEPVAGEIAVPAEVPLVITEGNYLLLDDGPWRGVRELLDESWFVDVEPAQRHAQLLARHMRYGRSREDALAWIEHTDEPNARRIAATADRADYRLAWGLVPA
ncbi:nucleoside/nucleotide kinase family protein [Frateuria defendens]|uniref:nucleoside/nucleotide kinase family protein n=1 Tax=Frateuria defendens TaxID=2219559 RepID=UPI00066FC935|nr:nucleoside/nucleotide kinase family protein [Frateuria defendens]